MHIFRRAPRRSLVFRVSLLLAFVLLAVPAAEAADRFYEDLFKRGIEAADLGDAQRAAKLLRLACFGLLEEPLVLGRCLTHLALAQARLGDEEAFRATFRRILEVERRFGGYRDAELSPARRRIFEDHLRELIAPEDLESSPTFRPLAPKRDPVEVPVDEEPAAQPDTGEIQEAQSEETSETAALPQEVATALERARQVRTRRTREDFQRALEILQPLAERYPDLSELQHTAAALAYLLRRWQESRTYFERGGEIAPSQPTRLFSYAVVLYETGESERAAVVLRKCLRRLQRSPFVNEYAEKILGSER